MKQFSVKTIGAVAAAAAFAIGATQVIAGFYTYSNSLGSGQADTRVNNTDNSASDAFVTATMTAPSSGFNTNIPLVVSGTWSRAGTRAFSKVSARGAITNKGVTKGGDGIDSGDPALDALVTPSSACSEISLDAEPIDVVNEQNQIDPYAYQYLLNIEGTDKGTALKVVWYDWLLDREPADRDDIIANGSKLAELLFVGPINLQNYDCIQVRSQRGREFIQVVTAGTATSIPFEATCPGDVTVDCNTTLLNLESLVTIEGGVAPYNVTFSPPLDQLPNTAVTEVTAVVTDSNGCTTDPCKFNIIRSGNYTFSGFDAPIKGIGGSCSSPFVTIKRGSNLPVKFDYLCNGQAITMPPHVEVKNCVTGMLLASGDAIQQTSAVWHFNIDSGVAVFANATLEITVYLPGGYTKRVYVKLRG